MRIARLALPAFLSLPMLGLAPAQAAALVPHRAVYDLALEQAFDRSGITGISGRMVYEFNGSACDGYTVTFRFVTQIETADSARMTDQQTTTYEDGDGESFSFVTRSFIDEALQKELKGTARLSAGGNPAATVVSIEKPETQELQLEATQFPTQHLLELIRKAEEGDSFYETTLFDGSEDANKVMTTTVIIGKEAPVPANDPEAEAIAPLSDDAFWPVDIAYFDMESDEGEELPTYRISFKLHENGVTRDLVMDYGDFSMTGRLVDLSLFDAPENCAE
ncbi:cell envelope integrity EipB family protein [Mesorhizobium microcysteis]|uniref:Cell envelope integrity EipB family protein n=1 Tax=Neoaquamicrobium microcysteis TaxID=2682781 RepID=A0A5D4GY63_9HYPH|nr:cell envelope integrity EipB family protein [Mesorhizobium microcysteis]TYR33801.1 cell envelope integrity EipB family protein [Mesorhizobium microcysteis]